MKTRLLFCLVIFAVSVTTLFLLLHDVTTRKDQSKIAFEKQIQSYSTTIDQIEIQVRSLKSRMREISVAVERLAFNINSIVVNDSEAGKNKITSAPYVGNERSDQPFNIVALMEEYEHNGKITIDITDGDREAYQIVQTRLDDPAYYSDLNLAAFAQSSEVQALPEMLRILLLDKAVTLFNQGYINRETFIGVQHSD